MLGAENHNHKWRRRPELALEPLAPATTRTGFPLSHCAAATRKRRSDDTPVPCLPRTTVWTPLAFPGMITT